MSNTTQLTIRQHLETLPSPYREWALENMEKDPDRDYCFDPHEDVLDALLDAFTWGGSPQGDKFWDMVYSSLKTTGSVPNEVPPFISPEEAKAARLALVTTPTPEPDEFTKRWAGYPTDWIEHIMSVETDLEWERHKRAELEEAMSRILRSCRSELIPARKRLLVIHGIIRTEFPHIEEPKDEETNNPQ